MLTNDEPYCKVLPMYPGTTMLFFKLQWITVAMNMLLI